MANRKLTFAAHAVWVVFAVALLALVVGLLAAVSTLNERDRQSIQDRRQLREWARSEEAARKALEQQVRQLGEEPVVDSGEVGGDVEVVIIPGEDGQDGKDGRDGRPGRNGRDGVGQPGQDGTDGAPGARGPSCVEDLGIEPCRGPKGDPGADGRDGQDGADGTARPGTYACPDGQYLTGFTVTESGDVELTCAAPFPGGAPQ